MAKNPKVKDPTEVALSAIQEALNIGDLPETDNSRDNHLRNEPTLGAATRGPDNRGSDLRQPADDLGAPVFDRLPANDDRETIGNILQAIQKGRPRRNAYTVATLFSGLWIAGVGFLAFAFLPALESIAGLGSAGALAMIGLIAVLVAPLLLFYFLASMAWRSQEMSMIAQSMAQMAVRFSEPEHIANGSIVTVGQAIRREVAAMGDGVERAIARAGELEALVANEVSSLERAYSDNEVRIRACSRTSRFSATTSSARPSRSAMPFPACRSTCVRISP